MPDESGLRVRFHSGWKARDTAVPDALALELREIGEVDEHGHVDTQNVHEADLLRTAGALSVLGLDLSLYLCKGYDCPLSTFRFRDLPPYTCPVEIKKRSTHFTYQITKYSKLPRAVVLCIKHDLVNPPDHIDVLELSTLSEYLNS